MNAVKKELNSMYGRFRHMGMELTAAIVISSAVWLFDVSRTAFHRVGPQWVLPLAGFTISLTAMLLLTSRRSKEEPAGPIREYTRYLSTPGRPVRLSYVVYEHDKFSHSGECVIERDNHGQVSIIGKRHLMRDKAQKDSFTVYGVRTTWHTDWCQVCDDGYLRFAYNIDFPGETVRGICEVRPTVGSTVSEIAGTYHRLQPGRPCDSAPGAGTIVFQANAGDGSIPPPAAKLALGPSVPQGPRPRRPAQTRNVGGTVSVE